MWLSQLKKISQLLEERIYTQHPRINAGGCGVVAAHLCENLRKLDYQADIIVHGFVSRFSIDHDFNIDEIRPHLNSSQNWSDWETFINCEYGEEPDMAHVGVKVVIDDTPYYLDGRGFYDFESACRSYGGVCKGNITVEEMRTFADAYWLWNYSFPREDIRSIRWKITNICNIVSP